MCIDVHASVVLVFDCLGALLLVGASAEAYMYVRVRCSCARVRVDVCGVGGSEFGVLESNAALQYLRLASE